MKKVVLAPTAEDKIGNWKDVTNIEEKAFPHLFPHGIEGYLSTYVDKGVMFSNCIKQRLNGIDRRYRNDCFLYHVKEALEIKRSWVTLFRNTKMDVTKYTKQSIKDIDRAYVERTGLGFKAF